MFSDSVSELVLVPVQAVLCPKRELIKFRKKKLKKRKNVRKALKIFARLKFR